MFPEKGWVVTANTGTACGRGGKKEVDVSCDPNSSSKSSAARRDIPERAAPKAVPWGVLSEKCLPAEGRQHILLSALAWALFHRCTDKLNKSSVWLSDTLPL